MCYLFGSSRLCSSRSECVSSVRCILQTHCRIKNGSQMQDWDYRLHGTECRLCRFNRIQDILKRAVGDSETTSDPLNSDDVPLNLTEDKTDDNVCERYYLLDRLKVQYRALCHTRVVGELHARGEVVHPLRMKAKDLKIAPCTYKAVQSGNQILFASALEFDNIVFPEFEEFPEKEKCDIITEFFYRFKIFEGCFRANELFPDHPDRVLPNFTRYLGDGMYQLFYDSIPIKGDLDAAARYIYGEENFQRKNIIVGRETLSRLQPDHTEFLAVVGLIFWSIDKFAGRHDISEVAEKYTKQIMKELHNYYREKLKMEDYAMRLGELLMLLQIFDVIEDFKQHVEIMRLLNLVDDESFVYRLQKVYERTNLCALQ
ncbi:hypothetical protein PRIPAC_78621 [Pristionchus pacificus]|nr:hypothetical protein PRIPAC_78621 [Pristionchus pacificus]